MRKTTRVEFSDPFKEFGQELINRFIKTESNRLRMTRLTLNALAREHGVFPLENAGNVALRDLLGSQGYKIQIGVSAVHVTRIPVTNVPREQWPALIENICEKLEKLFAEKGEPILRLWPAAFRNIATVWPADHYEFNQMCSDQMHERGFTLTFHVNNIDLRRIGTEGRRGKRREGTGPEVPKVEIMNGRSFLPIALAGRRVSWRRGFTHALMIGAQCESGAQIAMSRMMVFLPDAVTDNNGHTLTCLALSSGDVVLVNQSAYDQLKTCAVYGVDQKRNYKMSIQAVDL